MFATYFRSIVVNIYNKFMVIQIQMECESHVTKMCYTNVTGSAKSGLIAHDRKFNFFFVTNTMTHQYTIKFHCQNEEVLGGLLLLAASSQPIGDPYERFGSILELWWEGRGLSVTVNLHGAE